MYFKQTFINLSFIRVKQVLGQNLLSHWMGCEHININWLSRATTEAVQQVQIPFEWLCVSGPCMLAYFSWANWFCLSLHVVEHPLLGLICASWWWSILCPWNKCCLLSRLSGTMTLAIWIHGWGHQGLQTVPSGMMLTGSRTNAASLQLEGKE